MVLQPVGIDEAGLAVDEGAARGLREHRFGVASERRVVGCRHALPEFGVHHDGVVGRPQAAAFLAADEVQHAGVAPGFGGHAGSAAGAADLHFHRQQMVQHEGLFPTREGGIQPGTRDDVEADVQQGTQQGNGAGRRAALHAGDRAAGGADGGQVQHQRPGAFAAEGHRFQDFHRLGPAFPAVGDGMDDGTGRRGGEVGQQFARQERVDGRLRHAQVGGEALARRTGGREIQMRRGEVQQQCGRLGPVHQHQSVVIGAADAGAVQQ